MNTFLQVFPAELPVFMKEHKLGMYRCDTYFISKMLAEVRLEFSIITFL